MRTLSIIAALSAVTGLAPGATEAPVVDWLARPDREAAWVAGAVAGADGTVSFAALTRDSNPATYVATVSTDGKTLTCAATIPDLTVSAVAKGPAGSLFIGGVASGPEFPVSPGTRPRSEADNPPALLLQTDGCGQVRHATYLPKGSGRVALVAAALEGTAYVVSMEAGRSKATRVDPASGRVLASAEWDGDPGAATVDGNGRLLVTGRREPNRAYVKRFSAQLAPESDFVISDTVAAQGTALATDPEGFIWVGVERILSSSYSNFPYLNLRQYHSTIGGLAKLGQDGTVVFLHWLYPAGPSHYQGARNPVSIHAGPDGRMWLAMSGDFLVPEGLPEVYAGTEGLQLSSYHAATGEPAGGTTLVPRWRPAVAIDQGGRVTLAGVNFSLPATPGSLGEGESRGNLAVLAMDLSRNEAPKLSMDRARIELELPRSSGRPLERTVKIGAGPEQPLRYVAKLLGVWEPGPFVQPPPPNGFEIELGSDALPTTVTVRGAPGFGVRNGSDLLVVLAPGAQGVLVAPVGARDVEYFAVGSVIVLPGTTNSLVRRSLTVNIQKTGRGGPTPEAAPFEVSSTTAWLRLEQTRGTSPAELAVTIDARGLSPGDHGGQLEIRTAVATFTSRIMLRIEPRPLVPAFERDIVVPAGPLAIPFEVTSSGGPIQFTAISDFPGLQVTPSSGQTPQAMRLVFDATGQPPGQRSSLRIALRRQNSTVLMAANVVFAPPSVVGPDQAPGVAAPGSIIEYSAGSARCATESATELPWPASLGGCTLRINGRALPLKRVTLVDKQVFPWLGIYAYLERTRLVAQIPYDEAVGDAQLELEGNDGRKTALRLRIEETAPAFVDFNDPNPVPEVQAGDRLALRLTGCGRLTGTAVAGQLIPEGLRPAARIEVFVGGRPARVVSMEPSRTEPGEMEVTVEVPALAPDSYEVGYRLGWEPVREARRVRLK